MLGSQPAAVGPGSFGSVVVLSLLVASLLSQTLVPAEGYVPKVGDDVQLYNRLGGRLAPVTVAKDRFSFSELQKFTDAGDSTGLKNLRDKAQTSEAASGTYVKVIDLSDPALDRDSDFRYARVRILDGDQKDRLIYVDKIFVRRCEVIAERPAIKAPAKKMKPAPKPIVAAKAAPGEMRVGSIVKIGADSEGKGFWMAKAEGDFAAMADAEDFMAKAIAGKKPGAGAPRTKLANDGKIRFYAKDAQAKVLKVGEPTLWVEILDGADKGLRGYAAPAMPWLVWRETGCSPVGIVRGLIAALVCPRATVDRRRETDDR